MNEQMQIRLRIEKIIEETKRYDFPFLATVNEKWQIIEEKKFYIEIELKQLLPKYWPNANQIEALWNESIEYANKRFDSLPEKIRINGFYLQELMHYYAEHLGNFIMLKNWGK